MKLQYLKDHLSIKQFKQITLPNFTILTGINGAGKTHLLRAIENGSIKIEGIKKPDILYFDYNNFKISNGGKYNTNQLQQSAISAWKSFEDNIRHRVYSVESTNLKDSLTEAFSLCKKNDKSLWDLTQGDIDNDNLYDKIDNYKRAVNNFFYKENSNRENSIFKIIRNLKFSVNNLSEDDFYDLYKISESNNNLLINGLGAVMWKYWTDFLDNESREYLNKKNNTNYKILSKKEFYKKHGDKPWNVISKVLEDFCP